MMRFFDPTTTHRPNLYRIVGPDAADYLQRMTTTNIKTLSSRTSAPGLFLTPQGRIKCFFTLHYQAPETFYVEFETPERVSIDFDALIEEFRFAEKFTVEKLNWRCLWLLDESPLAEDFCEAILIEHAPQALGRKWVSAWQSSLVATPQSATEISAAEIETVRIQNLSPRVGHEIMTDQNPLEIHLDWAIAPNKGCYPGQEVIEKIVSLGSPARRLCRLSLTTQSTNAPAIPNEVRGTNEDTAPVIGKLTSYDPITGTALAIVRKTEAQPQKTLCISSHPFLFATVLEIASS